MKVILQANVGYAYLLHSSNQSNTPACLHESRYSHSGFVEDSRHPE